MGDGDGRDGVMEIGCITPLERGAISCCMIARDEAARIAGAIASVRNLAREVIVVDTGSMDGTPGIARRAGARVFSRPWSDDFSEARNYSVSKARGEWVLVLDADEALDGRYHQRIRELASSRSAGAYILEQRTWTADREAYRWKPASSNARFSGGMPGYFAARQVRLLRRRSFPGFRGRIFEGAEEPLAELRVPVLPAGDIAIDHYGRAGDCDRVSRLYDLYRNYGLDAAPPPGSLPYLFDLAARMTGAGEGVDALPLVRAAVGIEPDCWRLANLEGLALLAGSDPAGAMRCFSRAVDLGAEIAEPFNNLGAVLIESGRDAEALEVLRRGLEIEPDHPVLLRNAATSAMRAGLTAEAGAFSARALESDPFSPEGHLIRAEMLVCRGDREGAAESLGKIRFLSGAGLKASLRAVRLYMRIGMTEEARAVAERAIERRPGHEGLLLVLGSIMEAEEDWAGAGAVYRRVLALDPSNFEAHNAAGCACGRLGDTESALRHFEEAHRLSPSDARVETNLGITLYRLGRDEEAGRHLSSALEKDPRCREAVTAMAGINSRRLRDSLTR